MLTTVWELWKLDLLGVSFVPNIRYLKLQSLYTENEIVEEIVVIAVTVEVVSNGVVGVVFSAGTAMLSTLIYSSSSKDG